MRVNYNYIKILGILLLVIFLFAFSNHRNSTRKISAPNIQFTSNENGFIPLETVSKLLIQNQETVTNKPKEIIDLNTLEFRLNSNPMIKKADVYMSVNGELIAKIEQKRPIARVQTNASYYIDDEGFYMPLSTNHSARVPLVTGSIAKNDLKNVFTIATEIFNDEFLKKHVIEIHQHQNKTIDLKFRMYDFTIKFGTLNQLNKKINNLKAFYQKSIKDKTVNSYSTVNLKFDTQVICTKK